MILITGGSGFIGSALARELNARGESNIIIADRKKYDNLKHVQFAQYREADDLLASPPPQLDMIFHLGACSSTLEKNIDWLTRNNLNYSQKIFELAIQLNCPLLYASSAATYGSGELGYSDRHQTIPSLKPLNPYGQSKQDFDQWVLRQKNFPPVWMGLKFFNVYGPNEYHKGEMRSMVHKAHGQILQKGSLKLFKSYRSEYGHGEQMRDFIYVKDVVRAMLELSKIRNQNGIYNIGTGTARSFKDLAAATFKALGVPVNIEYIDMPPEMREQYQYFTEAEMGKFFSILPNFSFSSLEEGIEDYAIFCPPVGQYSQQGDFVALEKGQNPVIEQVGRRNRGLHLVELGEGDFAVGIHECLLVNPAHPLEVSYVKSVLRTQIAGMFRFYLSMSRPSSAKK